MKCVMCRNGSGQPGICASCAPRMRRVGGAQRRGSRTYVNPRGTFPSLSAQNLIRHRVGPKPR